MSKFEVRSYLQTGQPYEYDGLETAKHACSRWLQNALPPGVHTTTALFKGTRRRLKTPSTMTSSELDALANLIRETKLKNDQANLLKAVLLIALVPLVALSPALI